MEYPLMSIEKLEMKKKPHWKRYGIFIQPIQMLTKLLKIVLLLIGMVFLLLKKYIYGGTMYQLHLISRMLVLSLLIQMRKDVTRIFQTCHCQHNGNRNFDRQNF